MSTQRALREHSKSTQRALRENSESTKKALIEHREQSVSTQSIKIRVNTVGAFKYCVLLSLKAKDDDVWFLDAVSLL